MLLKAETLAGIETGTIDLAFRKWKRPTVKAGGTLKTRIGVLAIDAVDVVTQKSITEAEAKRAGFDSRAALLEQLAGREGKLHRVRVHLAGEDPRIALRANAKLTPGELDDVATRLARMDARSKDGAWTRETLELIERFPARRAGDLADEVGLERLYFKSRVRRLKSLGLTESLKIGYRLSPRGKVVLAHLR